MKLYFILLFSIFSLSGYSQLQVDTTPNLIIITTDGFRWQEIFNGADAKIISNTKYVSDTSALKELFWNEDVFVRRKLLMPFVWSTFVKHGALYGNQQLGSFVKVANPYKFSYAGYNEIFTGYTDPSIIANSKKWNTNTNVLEYLNSTNEYKGKVAAFTSWYLFKYIFNSKKSTFNLNSGNTIVHDDSITASQFLINGVQQFVVDTTSTTRNDMLTFLTAKEYMLKHHPKVVYIGFGDTDEFAHSGKYDGYLQSAHALDNYIAQLWYFIKSDDFYKNNTSILITTDHGRGNKPNNWIRHDMFTKGSENSWLFLLNAKSKKVGEINTPSIISNSQIAKTIAYMLNKDFSLPNQTESIIYDAFTNANR